MGQYWTPILATASVPRRDFAENIVAWGYSHDFGEGLKLMEHSYTNGRLVGAVTNYMLEQETFFRVVWAGDYADPESSSGSTLYALADQVHLAPMKLPNTGAPVEPAQWLLNLDKNEAVDLSKCPVDREDWPHPIHPLPLLTAEGNGRGGGDFTGGSGSEYIGRWARDRIMVRPEGLPPLGTVELVPNFIER